MLKKAKSFKKILIFEKHNHTKSMKILHTADWHLGKLFNNISLLEDQNHILQQILHLIETHKPDVVLLAGDVYDRASPPEKAVAEFDNILYQIVVENQTPVIAIAGNHDSADRIDYCNTFLAKQGLYIQGLLHLPLTPTILKDQFGEVFFYSLPYTEPETMRFLLKDQAPEVEINAILTHKDVMQYIVNQLVAKHKPTDRIVIIAHLFVVGGKESKDSERPLSMVGGAAEVPADLFNAFSYTALGHLHEAQVFENGKVVYAGSPLKYSFSEAKHHKSAALFELSQEGTIVNFQQLPLVPKREMLQIKGRIENEEFYLETENISVQKEDFLEILLQNHTPVLNAMKIVQEKYPNAMKLSYNYSQGENKTDKLTTAQVNELDETSLFTLFYKKITNQDLVPTQQQVIATIVQELKQVK
jgi:DNA repair protein SbcD/Mre11